MPQAWVFRYTAGSAVHRASSRQKALRGEAMVERSDPGTAFGRSAPDGTLHHVLLVRARDWLCALPIATTVETMRALPIRKVEGAPPFVRGLSLVRGALLPVVNLASILGTGSGSPESEATRGGRFVTVRTGDRQLVLEVDAVLGATQIDAAAMQATPPLLSGAMPEAVEKLGTLDRQTLAILATARLVPDELWSTLIAQQGAR